MCQWCSKLCCSSKTRDLKKRFAKFVRKIHPTKKCWCRKMKRGESSETRFGKVWSQSEPSSGGKRPFKIFVFSTPKVAFWAPNVAFERRTSCSNDEVRTFSKLFHLAVYFFELNPQPHVDVDVDVHVRLNNQRTPSSQFCSTQPSRTGMSSL